jgi:hypothetical protein
LTAAVSSNFTNPAPDSAKVIALIQGQPLCHTPFHELEFVNALQLKSSSKTRLLITDAVASKAQAL